MRTLHVLNDTVAARVQFVPSGMKYTYCMQSYISRHNLTRSKLAGVGQERKKFEGGRRDWRRGRGGRWDGRGAGEPQPSQSPIPRLQKQRNNTHAPSQLNSNQRRIGQHGATPCLCRLLRVIRRYQELEGKSTTQQPSKQKKAKTQSEQHNKRAQGTTHDNILVIKYNLPRRTFTNQTLRMLKAKSLSAPQPQSSPPFSLISWHTRDVGTRPFPTLLDPSRPHPTLPEPTRPNQSLPCLTIVL